jgi:HEAT repeat protein
MRKLLLVLLIAAITSMFVSAQPDKVDPEKVLATALKNIKLKDQIDARVQAAMDLADFGPKAEPAMGDLLDAMQTKNEDLRLNASIALSKIGKAAVKPVAGLLNDEDNDTRYYAVFTIAAIGPDAKETLPTMIKLASDKNEGIRRKAVYALGRLAGDPDKTIDVLVKAFKDENEDVRQAAGDALSKFGTKAVPHLIDLLKEANAGGRLQAATSLGEIGGDAKDAVPLLKERFLAKNSENIHHYANVLAKIGKAGVPALEAGLKDGRPELRQAAAQALQQVGAEAVGVLIDGLGEKNVEVRRLCANTLANMRIGDKSVVIALAFALSDADEHVRQASMNGLAILGPQAKLGAAKIKEALIDMNPQVRVQAYHLLQQIGDDPRPTFKKALQSKDDKVRINTASLMVNVNFDVNEAIPVLSEALKNNDLGLKMQAAHALASRQLQTDKLLPFFIEGLKHESAGVRLQAVQGCGMLRSQEAAVVLASALADKDANVRQQAVYQFNNVPAQANSIVPALSKVYDQGQAGTRNAVLQVIWRYGGKAKDVVMTGLKDKDSGVRQQAIFALQNLQGDLTEALPTLVALMKDKDSGINRPQLVWVISRGGVAAVPHLSDLVKDKDANVRQTALQALNNQGANAKAAIPAVKGAVNDEDGNVRLQALIFLSRVGGEGPEFLVKHFHTEKDANTRVSLLYQLVNNGQQKHVLPLLKPAMQDKSPQVRQAAVNVLYAFDRNSKESFEVFTMGLKDADNNVRTQAAYNAGNYGNKAWDPLADALKSTKDGNFRQAILQGMLGTQFKSKTAVAPLTDCLSDANVTVKHWACAVLGNIGPDAADSLPALRKLTNDPNQAVQNSARNAIQRIEPKKQ